MLGIPLDAGFSRQKPGQWACQGNTSGSGLFGEGEATGRDVLALLGGSRKKHHAIHRFFVNFHGWLTKKKTTLEIRKIVGSIETFSRVHQTMKIKELHDFFLGGVNMHNTFPETKSKSLRN